MPACSGCVLRSRRHGCHRTRPAPLVSRDHRRFPGRPQIVGYTPLDWRGNPIVARVIEAARLMREAGHERPFAVTRTIDFEGWTRRMRSHEVQLEAEQRRRSTVAVQPSTIGDVMQSARLLALVAALVEPLAEDMLANYTLEEWQESPHVDRVREAAEALATAGLDVPVPVREVLTRAEAARRG